MFVTKSLHARSQTTSRLPPRSRGRSVKRARATCQRSRCACDPEANACQELKLCTAEHWEQRRTREKTTDRALHQMMVRAVASTPLLTIIGLPRGSGPHLRAGTVDLLDPLAAESFVLLVEIGKLGQNRLLLVYARIRRFQLGLCGPVPLRNRRSASVGVARPDP